jgi:hypothetical protein
MTTTRNQISNLTDVAATLPGIIAKLSAAKTDLAERMAAIKRLGLIYASPHMKDGKYMILLYPIQPGQPRRRTYVGKEPQKVQEALEAIQRGKDYAELSQQAERLESTLASGYRGLQDAVRELGRWKSDY